jgi:hypothetical protein
MIDTRREEKCQTKRKNDTFDKLFNVRLKNGIFIHVGKDKNEEAILSLSLTPVTNY